MRRYILVFFLHKVSREKENYMNKLTINRYFNAQIDTHCDESLHFLNTFDIDPDLFFQFLFCDFLSNGSDD